jgi:hypothetical protein
MGLVVVVGCEGVVFTVVLTVVLTVFCFVQTQDVKFTAESNGQKCKKSKI